MKYFNSFLIFLAIALIIYNSTLIDFEAPFREDSLIAVIGVVAALCAILLVVILMLSKKIQQKIKHAS